MCLCAEGIWCDGSRCFCVLRLSGVMWVGVLLCAEGIWCDGEGVFVC